MAGGLLIGALLAAGSAPSAAGAASLMLPGDELRVGDIAAGASDPDLVVARFPRHISALQLSEDDRRALLRARIPGAQLALRQKGILLVRRAPPQADPRHRRGSCFATRAALTAGDYVTREQVIDTVCTGAAPDRRLRYDTDAAAPVARRDIPAGTYLGTLRLSWDRPIGSGDPLVLRTRIGAVMIERRVTALRAQRAGARLFVRTEDGKLATSRIALAAAKEPK